MPTPHTLLCTVGTSLFYPNLSTLACESQTDPVRAALAQAYASQDWSEVAAQLHQLSPTERLCGAEINSVADLLSHGHVVGRKVMGDRFFIGTFGLMPYTWNHDWRTRRWPSPGPLPMNL